MIHCHTFLALSSPWPSCLKLSPLFYAAYPALQFGRFSLYAPSSHSGHKVEVSQLPVCPSLSCLHLRQTGSHWPEATKTFATKFNCSIISIACGPEPRPILLPPQFESDRAQEDLTPHLFPFNSTTQEDKTGKGFGRKLPALLLPSCTPPITVSALTGHKKSC